MSLAEPPRPPDEPESSGEPDPAAGRMLGAYRLERPIGWGGMATVYAARDTRLDRPVAVKVLFIPPHRRPDDIAALVGRMHREARAIGRLSHPNIVTILDAGEQDGLPFLVMELLEGETLRARLDRDGPLSPGLAAPIVTQIAAALDAAHAAGVLHRDLKPSNVMLGPDLPAPGSVKLMDFGVARQSDDTLLTQTGMMVGSPSYMAPETVRGEPPTPAADLWALGVLLYEMLTGRPPFSAETIPTVFYRILNEAPAPLPPGTPRPVCRVVARALERNPARRFPTAQALAAALRSAAGGASRPALVARRPRPHILAPAALLLAGATAVIIAWQQRSRPIVLAPVAPPKMVANVPGPAPRPAPVVERAPIPPARPSPTRTAEPPRRTTPPVKRAATPAKPATPTVKKAAAKTVPKAPGKPAPAPVSHRSVVPKPASSKKRVPKSPGNSRPSNGSLLARQVRLAQDYVRLRNEAARVDRTDPAAVAAYNRKVWAFRRQREQFNASVRRHNGR